MYITTDETEKFLNMYNSFQVRGYELILTLL